jgi:RNA polymerase sigma-32 factor
MWGRHEEQARGPALAEDPITLAALADEFGVSRERVRQIEVRVFEKV